MVIDRVAASTDVHTAVLVLRDGTNGDVLSDKTVFTTLFVNNAAKISPRIASKMLIFGKYSIK